MNTINWEMVGLFFWVEQWANNDVSLKWLLDNEYFYTPSEH